MKNFDELKLASVSEFQLNSRGKFRQISLSTQSKIWQLDRLKFRRCLRDDW